MRQIEKIPRRKSREADHRGFHRSGRHYYQHDNSCGDDDGWDDDPTVETATGENASQDEAS